MREQQAVSTSEFLENQLRELREKLQKQEHAITTYKEKYLGELPEQKDVNLRTLERLQQQLQLAHENNRRATERRQMLTNALGEIDTTVPSTVSPSAAGPSVTPADTAAARLNLLRQELAMTQTRFSDRYPDVVQLKEQIRVLEAKVEAEKQAAAALPKAVAGPKRVGRDLRVPPENAYVASLMTQLDQATVEAKTSAEEIRGINGQIAVYTRRLENTPKHEQELAILTRDYDTSKELFKSLLTKRGEADMASELELRQKGENFRVIEPARLPERPAGPNRFRLLLVGLALALGASGAAVVLAEQVDTSFRRVDEIRSTLPLPVLSAIPRITTEQDRVRTLRQRRWATAAVGFGLVVVAGTSFVIAHDNQGLVTLLTPSERLDATTPVAYVHNSALDIEGLLEYILQDWGVKSVAQTHAQRLFELNEFLIDQHKKGSSPVLVIDEAQNLSVPTLEAVRLLSNFETTSQKLMQILLVGQPELRDKLTLPELRQLKQRVGLRCHIPALSPEETRQYIRHRLRIARATDAGIFSDAAIQKISDYSQGTPRVINIVCDHCLLSGYADSKRRIDAGIVQEAVEYLEEGERREWKTRRSVSLVPSNGALWAARSGVALLVVMIIFLLAFAANALGWLAAMPGGIHP